MDELDDYVDSGDAFGGLYCESAQDAIGYVMCNLTEIEAALAA